MDLESTKMLPAIALEGPFAAKATNGRKSRARPSSQGGKPKYKVDRRDPEKRRQQNLQAQKRYREKRRQHIEELEKLAATLASGKRITSGTPPAAANLGDKEVQPASASSHEETVTECSASTTPAGVDTPVEAVPALEVSKVPNLESLADSWDPDNSVDPSALIFRQFGSLYQFTWVECGCPTPHFQIRTLPGVGPSPQATQWLGKPNLYADLYKNNLRLEPICLLSAIWSNCLQIGITDAMFCTDDSISPFFRPTKFRENSECSSGNDSVVRTVQSIFKTLKPDLRPTREQITLLHHPCIDILPFPTMRKNLLVKQGNFDEDTFFQDAMSGLICWGSTGIGRRDRKENGGVGSGTPWDVRSWEAKTWFIQKYWVLLGGEDGELVRQSEWWRHMRGDESDPLLTF